MALTRSIYCGPAPLPAELAERWNLDPVLIVMLVIIGAVHIGALRNSGPTAGRKLGYALAGWVTIAVAFISPLCAASSALFSARVVHHLLLVAVAAPLLVEGGIGRLLPARLKLRLPLPAVTVLHLAVFWFWHAPVPYDQALSHPSTYWLMQVTLFGSALLIWQRLLDPEADPMPTTIAIVGTVAQMGLLGAIITFANAPLYVPHLTTTMAWGLAPLEDQQLAGLIMWVPGAAPYALFLTRQLRRWSRDWQVTADQAP